MPFRRAKTRKSHRGGSEVRRNQGGVSLGRGPFLLPPQANEVFLPNAHLGHTTGPNAGLLSTQVKGFTRMIPVTSCVPFHILLPDGAPS